MLSASRLTEEDPNIFTFQNHIITNMARKGAGVKKKRSPIPAEGRKESVDYAV